MTIERPPIYRFDALAASYDEHAVVQREVASRLIERLDGLNFNPQRIVDLGCGTGEHTLALARRFRHAHTIGLDSSRPMLDRARRRRGRWRRQFDLLAGDAGAPPIRDAVIDLAFASLSLEWTADWHATLAALRRILRPGGLLLIATVGPDTLSEIKAGDRADHPLGAPLDAQRLGDALVRAGFQEPVIDSDWLNTTHARRRDLVRDLQHAGALLAAEQAAALEREGSEITTTWEIVYASAWAPEEGQPVRMDRGEEASVSVGSIGIRRRN